MKRIIIASFLLFAGVLPGYALPEYFEELVDRPVSDTNTRYVADLNSKSVWGLSAQVVYSSYVGTAVTFNQDSVNAVTNVITVVNDYPLGLPVLITLNSGTIASGLTANATYYVAQNTASSVSLSSSVALAQSLTFVDISTAPTGSMTLTPIALSGSPAIKLQASNDGVNYSDLYIGTDQCLVTFTSPYASSDAMWDFGNVYFRYLRLNYTSGTWGAVNLRIILNGKSFQ